MGKIEDYKIVTLGSHSALQILKGARDEGFKNICVCQKDRVMPYKSFDVADEIIEIDGYEDFFKIEDRLLDENAILIPHGSLVQYLKPKNVEKLKMMHYGTKGILEWESDRDRERVWLEKARLRLPDIIEDPDKIDRPVIIKFHGAGGGKDYFIANSPTFMIC